MLSGSTDQEKLSDLAKRKYKDQAIWYLNAFWNDFAEKEANNIWTYQHKYTELDVTNKAEGTELDELSFHRFLEQINSTMTVAQCRNFLRDAGVDMSKIAKYVSLVHYLTARYKSDWHKLVNASQGDNQEELDHAQRLLDEVQELFRQCEKSAAEAAQKEAELKQAEAEVTKSLQELKDQEDEFNNRTETLKRQTQEGSTVQKSRASNELAQHLASDPLPLRRAKLNTEAAKRKAERAVKAAEEARQAADKAVEDARNKVAEAEAYLVEVSNKTGSAKGALWWMDKELQEAKKYLPQRRGGVAKTV
jgi:chromosome segregation ATPase